MPIDTESVALSRAAAWVRERNRRESDIRAHSEQLVTEQADFFARSQTLIHAALDIGLPDSVTDVQQKAVLSLTKAQSDLLESGWNAMLSGHYVAAAQPLRLIDEYCDYIPAAALDADAAGQLMNNGKLQVGSARKILVEELARQGLTQAQRDTWWKGRQSFQNDLNAFAHARTPLLVGASHIDQNVVRSGHAFNEKYLISTANTYAGVSIGASTNVGIALGKHLPDEGAWSLEQARLLDEWNAYKDTHDPS